MKLSLPEFIEVLHGPLELSASTNVESIIYAMRLLSPETDYLTELTLTSPNKSIVIEAMLALEKDANKDLPLDKDALDFMVVQEAGEYSISFILQGRDGLTFLKTIRRLENVIQNQPLILKASEVVHEKAQMYYDFSTQNRPNLQLILDQENLESLRATVLALGDFLSSSDDFSFVDYSIELQ